MEPRYKIGQIATVEVGISDIKKHIYKSLDTIGIKNLLYLVKQEFKIIGIFDTYNSNNSDNRLGWVLLEVDESYSYCLCKDYGQATYLYNSQDRDKKVARIAFKDILSCKNAKKKRCQECQL